MKTQVSRWSGKEVAALIVVGGLFVSTRLFHIQARYLPIFVDEAIYVWWAQLGKFEPAMRLVSLSDGKQPLFVWLTSLTMQWVGNPLIAGRLVSVLAGAATLIGLYLLSQELFKNRWTGVVAGLLYTAFPLALVLNRFALYESLVGAIFILGLYVSVVLTRNLRTESAFILALVLGAGLLTKTSGFMSVYLLPVCLLLFDFTKKLIVPRLVRWAWLSFVSVGLALVYYAVLLLSPQLSLLSEKNSLFLYGVSDVLRLNLFQVATGNLIKFGSWLAAYFTWPWIILLALSFYWKVHRRETLFLWLCFLLPFLVLAVLGKLVYPRYLFFLCLPLLPVAAETLRQVFQKIPQPKVAAIFMAATLFLVGFSDYKILTDFARSPIPEIDLFQYVNGWPAGGGIRETVNFLQKESEKSIIYVYSEGIYGSLPTTAINIYFRDNANVKHQGIAELTQSMPGEIILAAERSPVYVILNETQEPPPWPMDLVVSYQKGIGKWYLRLYRINPAKNGYV